MFRVTALALGWMGFAVCLAALRTAGGAERGNPPAPEVVDSNSEASPTITRLRRMAPVATENYGQPVFLKPLEITNRMPAPDQEIDLSDASYIVAIFDQDLDPQFADGAMIVEGPGMPAWAQPYQIAGHAETFYKGLIFFPDKPLREGVTYRATVFGGERGPRSVYGTQLPQKSYWYFEVTETPDHSSACSGPCFGVYCQDDFENNWHTSFEGYACSEAGHFVSRMSEIATNEFYTTLNANKTYFEDCDHCRPGGLDTVHLAYVNTHGTTNAQSAFVVMPEQDTYSASHNDGWRFGDTNSRLAFLVLHACSTLQIDEHTGARWIDPFRGGLLMALGSHITLYVGAEQIYNGREFAQGLKEGKSAKWAWYDGLAFGSLKQDVAVMASGSTTVVNSAAADCALRRDTLTWQNFGAYTRWRDDQVEALCMSWIDNY